MSKPVDTSVDPIKEYQKEILRFLETYRRYTSSEIHTALAKGKYSHFTLRDTVEALAYLNDDKKIKVGDDLKYKIGARRK